MCVFVVLTYTVGTKFPNKNSNTSFIYLVEKLFWCPREKHLIQLNDFESNKMQKVNNIKTNTSM